MRERTSGGVLTKAESEPQATKLVLLGLQLLGGEATVKELSDWMMDDAINNTGVERMDIVDLINCDPSALMQKMAKKGLINRILRKRVYVYMFIGELPEIITHPDHYPDDPHY